MPPNNELTDLDRFIETYKQFGIEVKLFSHKEFLKDTGTKEIDLIKVVLAPSSDEKYFTNPESVTFDPRFNNTYNAYGHSEIYFSPNGKFLGQSFFD